MIEESNEKSTSITELRPSQEIYCCFNPFCSQPLQRYLKGSFTSHPQCLKWIVHINQIDNKETHGVVTMQGQKGKWDMVDVGDEANRPIQILIQQEPMFTILRSSLVKEQINSKVTTYMSKLREDILKKLDATQLFLKQVKIQSYFGKMIKLEQHVRKLVQGLNNNTIRKNKETFKVIQIVTEIQSSTILRSVDMVLNEKIKEYQSRLMKQITDIPKHLFCTKQSLRSDIGLNNQQSRNLKKYLKDKSDDHNRKMFKMANIFKCDQKVIYERKNPDLIVKCQMCPMTFSTEKRKQLMNIWDNLSDHLINSHLQQIGYNYEHLISGKENRLITVEEIMYKMTKYNYESLELIFRTGRKIYSYSYSNRKKLSIDILLKGQTSALPIRHIYIAENQQFFVIVGTIAAHMQRACEFSKPVTVYICNQTQVVPMKKIFDLLNIKNVTIISERKTEEDMIIYQEEEVAQLTDTVHELREQQEAKIDHD